MAANADDVFDPSSPQYAATSAATTPVSSPGGTTVQNGIETVTTTATKLFDWKKAAIVALILFAVYITWKQTHED